MENNQLISPAFPTSKQRMQNYWVRKSKDVLKEDFSYLWVLSRLFSFDDWKKIAEFLEYFFQVKIIINPLFAV